MQLQIDHETLRKGGADLRRLLAAEPDAHIFAAMMLAGGHADRMGWDAIELNSISVPRIVGDDNKVAQMLWMRRGSGPERSFHVNIMQDGSAKIVGW